jgi:hypothetical protein
LKRIIILVSQAIIQIKEIAREATIQVRETIKEIKKPLAKETKKVITGISNLYLIIKNITK